MRMRREALGYNGLCKEWAEEVEGSECVAVVDEHDERIRLRRLETHRAHTAAEGRLELVGRIATLLT